VESKEGSKEERMVGRMVGSKEERMVGRMVGSKDYT
jgi:hypothetical protein